MRNTKIGIILLAAGGSSRLGIPKQLVRYEGTSLIKYVAVTALITEFPVIAVLGACADEVHRELSDLPLETVVNDEWRFGISSSIKKGVTAFRKTKPNLEALIIMLCDQPSVSPETLQRLAERYERTGLPIIASSYEGTAGVPALFGYEMFGELLCLEGDDGAKMLIDRYEDSLVSMIAAPEAAMDVDTPRDVKLLAHMSSC